MRESYFNTVSLLASESLLELSNDLVNRIDPLYFALIKSSFVNKVNRDCTKFASKLPDGSLMICTKTLRLCQHLLILLLRIFYGNSKALEIHDLPRL